MRMLIVEFSANEAEQVKETALRVDYNQVDIARNQDQLREFLTEDVDAILVLGFNQTDVVEDVERLYNGIIKDSNSHKILLKCGKKPLFREGYMLRPIIPDDVSPYWNKLKRKAHAG